VATLVEACGQKEEKFCIVLEAKRFPNQSRRLVPLLQLHSQIATATAEVIVDKG
jgi:predicted ribosome-associated RNA-binding protein Tma20